MTLDDAIERLYALKVDTTTRDGDGTPHEKPHKPLLLLAAFDLIAPCPDHRWRVSAVLDPRRSTGERKLHHPAGQSVLLPKDPAFHPDGEGLAWRCGRLSA